ncbi:MAG: TonB-dependent receptor, partial [Alphaproteobacteria bacterium]|nr:TonB-dependent receptor [Alphaproteobacteria bacterium]
MKTLLAALIVFAALAATAAHAGPLAPAPRVIAKYDRNFIARSGSQTLEELLNTGIVRYFLTGGQALPVLVNGRPYASTSNDLDTLPLSAVERIELLDGATLGALGGSAVRGALNIVFRTGLDGFETHTLMRTPTRDGGDGWQGSVAWGGAVGEGRMTLVADILDRQEISGKHREHSRSSWQAGGSFDGAQNVSVGGNTVWFVDPSGIRSASLGDCDPANGYTGPLDNPPGLPVPDGDKGCGFAYGDLWWDTASHEQQTAILNLEHPLGDDAEPYLDTNVSKGASTFRYAPSVGIFLLGLGPGHDLLSQIETADGTTPSSGGSAVLAAHRFVGHGNRDWLTDTEEYDFSASVEGRLADGLGYEARLDAYRLDGSVSGNTFVHEDTIQAAIQNGDYDLANPLSRNTDHLQAIRDSSVGEENDFGSDYLGARLALEGSGFAIGGRNAAWTAGVEQNRVELHNRLAFRGNGGETYDVTEVLGSGGVSYAGERETVAAFAELALPLTDDLDLRVAGRRDDHDDVGHADSWRLAAEYRPNPVFTLRSSWNAGERTPSMRHLHSTAAQDHPFIQCDPGRDGPDTTLPRTCPQRQPRQVTREVAGNPDLDPSGAERLAVGAEARQGPFSLGVEWYRLSLSDLAGLNDPNWAVLNLPECGAGPLENCLERDEVGGVTIHDSFANVVDTEVRGVNTRFGGGFRTSWGVVGMRGAWRRITDAERSVAGVKERFNLPKDMIRLGVLARRGGLSVIWTANYRSGFRNSTDTGTFNSWTGHDLVADWAEPFGMGGARMAAGVFNLTDEG